jgi:hypothetical protein
VRTLTSAVAAATLIAGFAVADATGDRALGGVVLAAGGAWCTWQWRRSSGTPRAVAALGVFTGAFVLSHPLAHAIHAWPSVLTVSAVTAAATYAIAAPRTLERVG